MTRYIARANTDNSELYVGAVLRDKVGNVHRFLRVNDDGKLVTVESKNEGGFYQYETVWENAEFAGVHIECIHGEPQPDGKYYAVHKFDGTPISPREEIIHSDGSPYKFDRVNEIGHIIAQRYDCQMSEQCNPRDFPSVRIERVNETSDAPPTQRYQTIKHFNQWQTVLPLLIDMLNNGTDAVKRVAREELERMARDADRIR